MQIIIKEMPAADKRSALAEKKSCKRVTRLELLLDNLLSITIPSVVAVFAETAVLEALFKEVASCV